MLRRRFCREKGKNERCHNDESRLEPEKISRCSRIIARVILLQAQIDSRGQGKALRSTALPTIRELALKKPTYGTKMMAALLSRKLRRPVSRKLVKHAYQTMG